MNYYNENDPKAAAWLRELMRAELIPSGVVDETSITEISINELGRYTQCHFFAGIGGWSYALWIAGWPADRPVWTGSPPCQPFSSAGKGQVDKDKRHLWPAFRAAIAKCKPAICFGEQVASADGRIWLAGVRADLEELGYGVGAADLCAAGVGAPHRRQRLFWMAYTNVSGGDQWARSGQQPIRDEDCGNGAVADSERDGRRADEPGRESKRRVADWRAGGMGNAGRERDESRRGSGNVGCPSGKEQEEAQERERRGDAAANTGADRDGLGNAARGGCGERGHEALAGRGGHVERADWSRFEVIGCRDGKARRIEAGTFPLAHGVSGRMGLLRGYGNAIVPQVAAEFIKATCEVVFR